MKRAKRTELSAPICSASIGLTPRTDAELSYRPGDHEDGITPWVRASVSWGIERDYNAAKYALEEARQLLADICRGEVNPEDEADKWLRDFGWPNSPETQSRHSVQRTCWATGAVIRMCVCGTDKQPVSPCLPVCTDGRREWAHCPTCKRTWDTRTLKEWPNAKRCDLGTSTENPI